MEGSFAPDAATCRYQKRPRVVAEVRPRRGFSGCSRESGLTASGGPGLGLKEMVTRGLGRQSGIGLGLRV